MSKQRPQRRVSAIRDEDGKGADPHVARTKERALKKINGDATRNFKINLPIWLGEEIKAEAARLTRHANRGFSTLMTLLVRDAWARYKGGELSAETEDVTVERRIKT
jgi:hypothetical protein